MRNRTVLVVAALAAGTFGIASSSAGAATVSGDGTYRLARSAEGGNAPRTYNYVRSDAGGGRVVQRPYSLTGRGDVRYKAVTNAGGNARVINLAPQSELSR